MQTIRVADITINVESGDREFFDRRIPITPIWF